MKKIKLASLIVLSAFIMTGCGKKDDTFRIGVNQYIQHDALDASYQGFVDGLKEFGYVNGEKIQIDYQNAQGDQSNVNTIASKLVNDNNDLILAIATPTAKAVANATKDIPILVTAVTDPQSAGLVASNKDASGGNISGTSDMNPVQQQIELLVKLVPDVKKIALLYTSSEENSKIQADLAAEVAATYGIESVTATVSNSNEIQQVVESLVGKVDAIYAPTDNTIANAMPTVAMVANPNGIPVIAGEGGMVENGALATYGMDYYELGKLTAKQAVDIIEGTKKVGDIPIGYLPLAGCELIINEEVAKELGITIPSDLK